MAYLRRVLMSFPQPSEVEEPGESIDLSGADFYDTFTTEDLNTNGGINSTLWTRGTWTEHGGQLGTERCYVAEVDGGRKLHLILHYDSDNEPEGDPWYWNSAIETKKTDFGYGRWEYCAKLPDATGLLASFFTINWTHDGTASGGDTDRQEIDLEFPTRYWVGQTREGWVHTAFHGRLELEGGGFTSGNSEAEGGIELDFNPAADYHIWGFELDAERIRWFHRDKSIPYEGTIPEGEVTLREYYYDSGVLAATSPYHFKMNFWTDTGLWVLGPPPEKEDHTYLIDWIAHYRHPTDRMEHEESEEPEEPELADTFWTEPTGNGHQLEQYGITWTFSESVEYGQFVNGDYFVLGPVTVTSVSPEPQTVNGWDVNGSMINPPSETNGYDSRTTHWNSGYTPQHRVEFPVVITPEVGEPIKTLVSTIGVTPWDTPQRPAIQDSAALTVLDAVPIKNSFRPPIAGADKGVWHNYSDIRWDRLPQIPSLSSTPAEDIYQNRFNNPCILHKKGWHHRHTMVASNGESYHNDLGRMLSRACSLLATDKITVGSDFVVHFLQAVKDWYQVLTMPGEGPYNWSIVTTIGGYLLGDDEIMNMYLEDRNTYVPREARTTWEPNLEMESEVLPVANVGNDLTLGRRPGSDPIPYNSGYDTWTGYYERTGRQPTFWSSNPMETLHPSEWSSIPTSSPRTYRLLGMPQQPGIAFSIYAFGIKHLVNDAALAYGMRVMYESDDIIVDSHDSSDDRHGTSGAAWLDELIAEHESEIFAYIEEPN